MTSLDKGLTIHVSDSALLHLMFAGMESYRVRKWGKSISTNKGPAETAGLLWGYCVTRDDEEHIVVEHATTDKFAEGTANAVEFPIAEVTKVKQEIVASRWPYLSLVGDFHTHPYTNYTEAHENRGWEFSKGDRESYQGFDKENPWEGCVALVLTIAELVKYHPKSHMDPRVISENVIQWQLSQYRYWLAGYAIDRESEGTTQLDTFRISPSDVSTREQRPYVYLDVPTINGTSSWFDYT